jgi:hypothetical protein
MRPLKLSRFRGPRRLERLGRSPPLLRSSQEKCPGSRSPSGTHDAKVSKIWLVRCRPLASTKLIHAVLLLVVVAAACRRPEPYVDPVVRRAGYRAELYSHLQPVKLSNCEFERVGDKHDGGYVICRNLLDRAETIYSYGISASDNWGCTLSARLKRPVHQYDCFNTDRPPCEGATPVFHEECVGPERETLDGRLFDTVDAQIARNGDSGKRVVMKMDVEGAEWRSLLSMSDAALQQIDQLSVEFHGVEEGHYAETMAHLARVFHVANIHYNNWTCSPDVKPFQATAFEVLFVNKRLGVVEPGTPTVPNPFDSPNNWMRPDCQAGADAKPPVAP